MQNMWVGFRALFTAAARTHHQGVNNEVVVAERQELAAGRGLVLAQPVAILQRGGQNSRGAEKIDVELIHGDGVGPQGVGYPRGDCRTGCASDGWG